MENFRKVRTEEAGAEAGPGSGPGSGPGPGPGPGPGSPRAFSDLAPGALEMRVKEGSKIRNLLGFAAARMELPATRRIVFSGCGRAVTKTITCAEILKRRSDGLHQLTRLRYRGLREVWESRTPHATAPDPAAAAAPPPRSLTVHKNVPAVSILLSKDPLDPGQPGYQPPDPRGPWPYTQAEGPREMTPERMTKPEDDYMGFKVTFLAG
ncbi:ribonuclease P protein subunit p25 [Ornithorhynchus anatinus]|uniref:ribonuclease P protein subunit p25 n=1 Tax=Ornithorhynchus anatinus TaxID=9258 RepID=UPI0010A80CF3|nr:ribonuclease P protein subunit p25 [Ornithorhynchus anatinus]